MRIKWEKKPLVSKDTFDFTEKARVVFGKNKNGEDVTFKSNPPTSKNKTLAGQIRKMKE